MSEQSGNAITQAIEHVVSQEKVGGGGLLAGRTVVRLKDCKAGMDELAKLIQNQDLERDEVLWLCELNARNLQVVKEIKSHFSIKIKDFFLELFGYILASKAKKMFLKRFKPLCWRFNKSPLSHNFFSRLCRYS